MRCVSARPTKLLFTLFVRSGKCTCMCEFIHSRFFSFRPTIIVHPCSVDCESQQAEPSQFQMSLFVFISLLSLQIFPHYEISIWGITSFYFRKLKLIKNVHCPKIEYGCCCCFRCAPPAQSFTIHFYNLANGNFYFTQFDEFYRNSRMFECQ